MKEIQILAKGKHFKETWNVNSFVNLIQSHEAAYSQCIRLAYEKLELIPAQVQSSVHIKSVSAGSIDIKTVTDMAAAVAPLAPQIFDKAWLLYKSAYDLIGTVTQYFKINGKPMNITIQDSTIDAPLVIVTDNGHACVVDGDVMNATSSGSIKDLWSVP